MIVPDTDHWQRLVNAPQIGVAAICGIAQTIIGKHYDLILRPKDALLMRLFGRGIGAALIFIEVITKVNGQIGIIRLYRMRIGIKPTETVI